jgi:hypothetical protein
MLGLPHPKQAFFEKLRYICSVVALSQCKALILIPIAINSASRRDESLGRTNVPTTFGRIPYGMRPLCAASLFYQAMQT